MEEGLINETKSQGHHATEVAVWHCAYLSCQLRWHHEGVRQSNSPALCVTCVFKHSPSHDPPQRRAVFKGRFPVGAPQSFPHTPRPFLKCILLDLTFVSPALSCPLALLSLKSIPSACQMSEACVLINNSRTAGFHDYVPNCHLYTVCPHLS